MFRSLLIQWDLNVDVNSYDRLKSITHYVMVISILWRKLHVVHARRVLESQKLTGISNEILMGYHAMTLKWAVEYGSRERESELSKWECDLYAPRMLR